jgi:hypothetical protein
MIRVNQQDKLLRAYGSRDSVLQDRLPAARPTNSPLFPALNGQIRASGSMLWVPVLLQPRTHTWRIRGVETLLLWPLLHLLYKSDSISLLSIESRTDESGFLQSGKILCPVLQQNKKYHLIQRFQSCGPRTSETMMRMRIVFCRSFFCSQRVLYSDKSCYRVFAMNKEWICLNSYWLYDSFLSLRTFTTNET